MSVIIEQADLGLVTPQCPSKEAQDARLASLAGKRLLFVGGDFMYKSFAPPLVKQMQRLRSRQAHCSEILLPGQVL